MLSSPQMISFRFSESSKVKIDGSFSISTRTCGALLRPDILSGVGQQNDWFFRMIYNFVGEVRVGRSV
jgi:hypothetical protein